MSKVIYVMSVGKSGVGKSTIGNCMISGSPMAQTFPTSPSADFCTQMVKWAMSRDCQYCDVPGIPDTNPDNTKAFYDIIIKEARKKLNVILFVFKYERIDEEAYSRAKMLFRELKKSHAIKILVINDMNNYPFGGAATEADYTRMEASIKKCTDLEFSHVISMTGATMMEKMSYMKHLLSETKPYTSPHLKTYVQVRAYVIELIALQNYEEVVYNETIAEVNRITRALSLLEASVAGAAACTTVASVAAFFSFGATLAIAGTSAAVAAAAVAAIEIKKAELKEAQEKLSKDKLAEATVKLVVACKLFVELDNALTVTNSKQK